MRRIIYCGEGAMQRLRVCCSTNLPTCNAVAQGFAALWTFHKARRLYNTLATITINDRKNTST
jgi:hypothetical protein